MKFRNILFQLLGVALLAQPLNALAGDEIYSFGIGVGRSTFELDERNIIANYSSLTSAATFTDSSTSLLLSGGVRFDRYLSLDLDLLIQGDIKATEAGVQKKLFDVSTLAFSVSLMQDFNDRFSGFARLGVHLWDASVGSDSSFSVDSSVDLTYGLGMDINIYGGRERVLRVQWDHYDYDGLFLDSSDVLSLSLRFQFGY